MAPVDAWPKLRRDLLEFEMSIAYHQHDIGMVKGFWFDIDMPSHIRVHHQLREFNARQREWVANRAVSHTASVIMPLISTHCHVLLITHLHNSIKCWIPVLGRVDCLQWTSR